MVERPANYQIPVSQSSNKDGRKTKICVTAVEAAAGTAAAMRNTVMMVKASVGKAEEAKLKWVSSEVLLQLKFIG